MFQGSAASENRNRIPTAAQIARLDAVGLTHAPLDHTGRLPAVTKLGYQALTYCTRPRPCDAIREAIAERHGIEAELPDLFDLIEEGPAAAVAANSWHGRARR